MRISDFSLSVVVLFLVCHCSQCRRTYKYSFPGLSCGKRAKSIDGATLVHSHNEDFSDGPCIIKFRSHRITQEEPKFLVNFKSLHIEDCNVRLSLFDGRNDQGDPKVTFTCKSRGASIQRTSGKYLTLKLENYVQDGYEFEIIVTSYTDTRQCPGFLCWNTTECISSDLRCDQFDNCLDVSDEHACKSPNGLLVSGLGTILGMSMAFMTCCIASIVVITLCCRRRKRRNAGPVLTPVNTNKPMNVYSPAPAYNDYNPSNENHYMNSYSAVHSHGYPLRPVSGQSQPYAEPHLTAASHASWPSNARKIPEYV